MGYICSGCEHVFDEKEVPCYENPEKESSLVCPDCYYNTDWTVGDCLESEEELEDLKI